MVTQDVRGRWMSEGKYKYTSIQCKKKGKEIDEASDTYDAIDWLVKNIPHNNGKVGVYGISYPGLLFNHGCSKQSSCIKSSKSAGACNKLVYW